MAKSTKNDTSNSTRLFTTQSSLDTYVWGICNILRRSNCAGALQYVPELTWILFLRILDDREAQEADAAEAVSAPFTPSLKTPTAGRIGLLPTERSASHCSTAPWVPSSASSMASCCPISRGCETARTPTPARKSSAKSCRASSACAWTPKRTS